ncbi:Alpha-1B adrenergic receptor [Trichoplax sp. H2]|nr:Alpha-1B adrenergic receptor [Trichoplax sp. H2]|eukprot:RDD38809.1 Alpha-1B adrenergic receptor [Trichoplax sp. H2]
MDYSHLVNVSNQTGLNSQFHNSIELWTVIGIFTVISNSVLLICIAISKFTRNLFHVLIGSTFMIGILLGMFFIFPIYSTKNYIYESSYCTLLPMIGSSFILNYILHQLLICIDQYYRTRWPRHYRKFYGKKRWVIIIVLLWLFAHLAVAIPVILLPEMQPNCCLNQCDSNSVLILFYIYFIGIFVTPSAAIIVFYSSIYYRIWRKYTKVNSFSASNSSRHRRRKKNKAHIAAMRMGILAAIFMLMVLPFGLPLLAVYFQFRQKWILYLVDATRYIALFYPMLNPLLHSCLINTVKRALLGNMHALQQILSECFEIEG